MKRMVLWMVVLLVFLVGCGGPEEEALIYEEDRGYGDVGDENPCYPGEQYDPVEDVCYIECDTDAECAALEAEIYGDEAAFESDEEPVAVPETDLSADGESIAVRDDLPAPTTSDDGLVPFADYVVDQNFNLTLVAVVQDSAVDTAEYEAIWGQIRSLLPTDLLIQEVREYEIFTDGVDETLAYVEPLAGDPDHWMMGIDTADVQLVNGQLSDDMVHTIVHEFSHILTLENDQVPPDPGAGGDEASAEAEACQTFYTGEGCALSDSYINQFFYAFWDDIFDELLDIEAIEDQVEFEDAIYAFYEKYPDRFVTDYAATNPGEDIAESFTFFVLQDAPTGNSMADDKLRFFYDFSEMVAIREHIRGQLGL